MSHFSYRARGWTSQKVVTSKGDRSELSFSASVLKLGVFLFGALFIAGCGASAAHSSAEPISFDASNSLHRLGGMEMEMAAEEAEDSRAIAPQMAPPPSASRAKMAAGGGTAISGTDDALFIDSSEQSEAFVDEPLGKPRRPLLVYEADLGLGVFRVQENLDKIEKMALDAGGYLVTRGQVRIMVRVPAEDFERTVDAVLKLGDVHRREIAAHDVTAEFTDLEIRLKNALAMRERLEALLQKAQDVKEALKVEEQLGRVAEEIELMKGRLKYLREVTTFSTIQVEFSERSAPIDSRVELPFEWLQELGLNSLLRL